MKRIRIALVGDFDKNMHTHLALNESIEHCRPLLPFDLKAEWVSTEVCDQISSMPNLYDGIWIAPGSPYKNEGNVFEVIQYGREKKIPLFGTCGGFQFMVLEYARNELGIVDAGHAETGATFNPVISSLSCSLKGEEELVFIPDKASSLFNILKTHNIRAHYYCRYGVNLNYYEILNQHPFVFTAFSPTGEVRAFELRGHRFFIGTLFQPSLNSFPGKPNPVILSYFNACA
jgi:CTP synthase (UTP-ammonia lyase)